MGRDSAHQDRCDLRQRFNSRARMGRDRLERRVPAVEEVSTHAPAWGAMRVELV